MEGEKGRQAGVINWLEREGKVAQRGTQQGAGVTEIGLSDERNFCPSWNHVYNRQMRETAYELSWS